MAEFSIIVPTWNRADILKYTLANIDPSLDCEIVVSYDEPTDHTVDVIEAHAARDKRVRAIHCPTKGTFANTLAAFSSATTDIVIYMPDDDSILAEPLLEHVARMKAEPDLVAIFTDSIAWNDAEQTEIHRYFPPGMPATTFGPEHNVEIADFLLQTFIPPEIGVFRKDAAIKARVPVAKAQPYHIWAYNFSRLGKIRFDPLAFLREHRVLKPGFTREHWGNMDGAWAYVGSPQRLGLSIMYLRALRDAKQWMLPDWRRLKVHDQIEHMLVSRAGLEVNRALERGDFILASELRNYMVLWHPSQDREGDHNIITMNAAKQAAEMCGVEPETMVEAYRIG